MKKLSKSAYEDTKGFLRVAETLLEVAILTVIYYFVWRSAYDANNFVYKGKDVLMGIYSVLTYVFFQNADSTMFGQLNRVDLILGQIIALGIVNVLTFLQLCLIANMVLTPKPKNLLQMHILNLYLLYHINYFCNFPNLYYLNLIKIGLLLLIVNI